MATGCFEHLLFCLFYIWQMSPCLLFCVYSWCFIACYIICGEEGKLSNFMMVNHCDMYVIDLSFMLVLLLSFVPYSIYPFAAIDITYGKG